MTIDRYVRAATRDNTRRSYRSAVEHFEVTWGGFLPATADSVARYLADHAERLSAATLKQRLAALARWHRDQGFPDPTKAPLVRTVLKAPFRWTARTSSLKVTRKCGECAVIKFP